MVELHEHPEDQICDNCFYRLCLIVRNGIVEKRQTKELGSKDVDTLARLMTLIGLYETDKESFRRMANNELEA